MPRRGTAPPATCHPDRPKKLADGTCDRCYARNRYQQDPDVRERVKKRSREHWHATKRELTDEQREAKRKARRAQYERNPRRLQSHVLTFKYGITLDDYDLLLGEQDGKCGICGREPSQDRRLAVDHDHTTGQVRGLLCGNCNTGLGLLGDSRELLRAADGYLAKWGKEAGQDGPL